jgi:hypothetical protein
LIERDGRFRTSALVGVRKKRRVELLKRPCGGASARDDDSGERSFFLVQAKKRGKRRGESGASGCVEKSRRGEKALRNKRI